MIIYREWLNDDLKDSENNPASYVVVVSEQLDIDSIFIELGDCYRKVEFDLSIYTYEFDSKVKEERIEKLERQYNARLEKIEKIEKAFKIAKRELKKHRKSALKLINEKRDKKDELSEVPVDN